MGFTSPQTGAETTLWQFHKAWTSSGETAPLASVEHDTTAFKFQPAVKKCWRKNQIFLPSCPFPFQRPSTFDGSSLSRGYFVTQGCSPGQSQRMPALYRPSCAYWGALVPSAGHSAPTAGELLPRALRDCPQLGVSCRKQCCCSCRPLLCLSNSGW